MSYSGVLAGRVPFDNGEQQFAEVLPQLQMQVLVIWFQIYWLSVLDNAIVATRVCWSRGTMTNRLPLADNLELFGCLWEVLVRNSNLSEMPNSLIAWGKLRFRQAQVSYPLPP